MKIRNLSRGTQRQYLRVLEFLSSHFGKPAEELEVTDIQKDYNTSKQILDCLEYPSRKSLS